MIKIHSLSFRIITRVLLITLSLFILILTGYYYYTRNIIRAVTRNYAIQLAENINGKIEQELLPLEKIPQMVSTMLELNLLHQDTLFTILKTILIQNDKIYGAMIAFEPDFFPEKGKYYAPYAHRDNKKIQTLVLGSTDYEYFYMDWYQIPQMINNPYWSEPYFDEGGGNILMSTYSMPFYSHSKNGRKFAGVVIINVALESLTNIVSNIQIFETGYAFLMSRNGWMLTNPDKALIMNASIFTNAEEWNEPFLREIGRELKQGKSNFREYNLKAKTKKWIYYTNLPSSMWSIAVVYPDKEMFATLKQMNIIMIVQIIVGLFLLTLLTVQIVNHMASPLTLFAQSARLIAGGNFNVKLPSIKTKDEMQELHNAFSQMQSQLSQYIINLMETTAAKESMEGQLRIANAIQMGMIPKEYPAFPDRSEFNICGIMHAAKEVGGDLYNYFMIDDDHLGFTIGDVSGKGIPAALFMAMTNTLIKAIALSGLSPAEVLYKANNELCKENDQFMFVTLLFAILNIKTGEVEYANAGHNPFILIQDSNGSEYRKISAGMVLAAFEDFEFINERITLKQNDAIFMYTDGVTEAMNSNQNLFGEVRLLELIKKSGSLPIPELIDETIKGVASFVDGNEQSDDITILALRFLSPGFLKHSSF